MAKWIGGTQNNKTKPSTNLFEYSKYFEKILILEAEENFHILNVWKNVLLNYEGANKNLSDKE